MIARCHKASAEPKLGVKRKDPSCFHLDAHAAEVEGERTERVVHACQILQYRRGAWYCPSVPGTA
eukprot:1460138-Rhodomonas_salina.5